MKIQIKIDQKAMNKSLKFVYFIKQGEVALTEISLYTVSQAQTVYTAMIECGIDVNNQTGLNFN